MAGRSLRASAEGIERARTAYKRDGWTQEELKSELGLKTRQPITRFFAAQPIERHTFIDLCRLLGLEVEEIAEPESVEKKQGSEVDIDALVQQIRQKVKPNIKERCGTMRVLEAVKRHSKLMVLGKPGAGKTTFLKYLAMQCIEGQFQANRVPLFITLKDFAEAPKQPELLEYIAQQLALCGVIDASTKAEQLLRQGRALVLLDGLDEVREEDTTRVLREIREVSGWYHTNQFAITCRIAAKEYTFDWFTEVEVADFDQEQIAIFAQNWFRLSDPVKADRFIQKLKENEPIQELATNPLLLTLLCLVFGENADFPVNRSELYKEGLDVLLKKWDAKRNIERYQVYKNLSLQRKEDLLSQIALTTFEQKDYFFKQKTVEAYIADFISNLRDADSDPEVLRVDSEAVLKSIEAQHGLLVERAKGIYSFSHLTFQEYFTAREIVTNSAFESLVKYITDKRWQEVFLLAVGMMRKADNLVWLMKQNIDRLLAKDDNLQRFSGWVQEKARSVDTLSKPTAVRALYLGLSAQIIEEIGKFTIVQKNELLMFFPGLFTSINKGINAIDNNYQMHLDSMLIGLTMLPFDVPSLHKSLSNILQAKLDCKFRQSIHEVWDKLPDLSQDEQVFEDWILYDRTIWTEQLRAVMIEHRNIGHDWQFSKKQKELLKQYYDANKLLIDCLNSDCYVSREVRQEIEDTLLLPMSEIEKRQQGRVR